MSQGSTLHAAECQRTRGIRKMFYTGCLEAEGVFLDNRSMMKIGLLAQWLPERIVERLLKFQNGFN